MVVRRKHLIFPELPLKPTAESKSTKYFLPPILGSVNAFAVGPTPPHNECVSAKTPTGKGRKVLRGEAISTPHQAWAACTVSTAREHTIHGILVSVVTYQGDVVYFSGKYKPSDKRKLFCFSHNTQERLTPLLGSEVIFLLILCLKQRKPSLASLGRKNNLIKATEFPGIPVNQVQRGPHHRFALAETIQLPKLQLRPLTPELLLECHLLPLETDCICQNRLFQVLPIRAWCERIRLAKPKVTRLCAHWNITLESKVLAFPMEKCRCTKEGILLHRKSVQSPWVARWNNNVPQNMAPESPISLLLKLQCACKLPEDPVKTQILILWVGGGA